MRPTVLGGAHENNMLDYNLKDPKNPSGPVNLHNLKVRVDRDLCIGAGTCVAIASKAFELDPEAKAVILSTSEEEEAEVIIDAAKGCPVAAIIIENEKGEKVYPK